jgi:hypothetical protein
VRPKEPLANSDSDRGGRWPLWRRLMVIGSLILLATVLANAVMDGGMPRPVEVIATAAGFVLLAVGFGQRMRSG